jgi:tRNA(Ile2) C34 agmatinyltransferase TiaS
MEPWRWRCPEGHTSWEVSGEGYRCRRCRERFPQLVDARDLLDESSSQEVWV